MCTAILEKSTTNLDVQKNHGNTNSSKIDGDVIIRQYGGSVILKKQVITHQHRPETGVMSYNNYKFKSVIKYMKFTVMPVIRPDLKIRIIFINKS